LPANKLKEITTDIIERIEVRAGRHKRVFEPDAEMRSKADNRRLSAQT